jgi:hypothetical protein
MLGLGERNAPDRRGGEQGGGEKRATHGFSF